MNALIVILADQPHLTLYEIQKSQPVGHSKLSGKFLLKLVIPVYRFLLTLCRGFLPNYPVDTALQDHIPKTKEK